METKRHYTEKELEPILKELVSEELKHIQEMYFKKLEGAIEEMVMGMDQRIRRLEMDQQGLKNLLLEIRELLLEIRGTTSEEIIEFRKVSKEEARLMVKNYVINHPGCLTSEIIQDLKIDPELVVEILNELVNKGEIKGDYVGE